MMQLPREPNAAMPGAPAVHWPKTEPTIPAGCSDVCHHAHLRVGLHDEAGEPSYDATDDDREEKAHVVQAPSFGLLSTMPRLPNPTARRLRRRPIAVAATRLSATAQPNIETSELHDLIGARRELDVAAQAVVRLGLD